MAQIPRVARGTPVCGMQQIVGDWEIGGEQKTEQQFGQGAQGKEQKAEQQFGQGKGIRAALRMGVGLCGMPAKSLAPAGIEHVM